MLDAKKITKRKLGAEKTKEKIFLSAKHLFSKYSYKDVTIDDIVKHAGVAKGSFYVYFKSKDELVATLISDYVNEVDTEYGSYLDSLDESIKAYDMLMNFVVKIADVLQNKIGCDSMKILYRIQLTEGFHVDSVINYSRKIYKLFESIVQKGIETGELSSTLDGVNVARNILVAYRGITYEWCVRYPSLDLIDEVKQHFTLLIRGLRA